VRDYLFILILLAGAQDLYSDSFKYNSFNNHGVIGLVNMPSARFYDEATHGLTIYDGSPDQKITMTSSPYNWMEASFFYMNATNSLLCRNNLSGQSFCQSYKDKGFNFKFRLKEEGSFPALAIGVNDVAGTGFYSSEYIVGSYGVNMTDFHFGLGWGTLNNLRNDINNPLAYLYSGFNNRPYTDPVTFEAQGGQFQIDRYFSGNTVSPFFGISQIVNNKISLKIEYDTTLTPGLVSYQMPKSDFTYGLELNVNSNFTMGLAYERGNYTSFKFIYKNNSQLTKPEYKYKKAEFKDNDNKYAKLIKSIEANGIGVNKIIETPKAIGLELTQFTHPNLDIVENIIRSASFDAGIKKPIKKELRVASLQAVSEYNKEFENNSLFIYQRKSNRSFNTKTNFTFRPYLASREDFFKGALLLENNSELIIKDNFFFSTNLKYSITDNFKDLTIPPVNTYPAQVRSDVKDYLRSFSDGIFIGRAQFDYHITPKKNHHLMVSAGILEEMFSGIGLEYLYFKQDSNYAFGFEIFDVTKRDYEMRFGTLEYKNVTGSANFYYRNYEIIPFDAKISYGEYLAGDEGVTFELSRSFLNGTKFGVFASFTDVSSEQFGEGTFDKGIFFNIPVYGNFINYSWRPLTKDPGAKLNRKHTLHDLLIKFKPYNY
jgi:hypothetical protein